MGKQRTREREDDGGKELFGDESDEDGERSFPAMSDDEGEPFSSVLQACSPRIEKTGMQ